MKFHFSGRNMWNDEPIYLPPAVIDLVTIAQGHYERCICGAAMIDRKVLEIVGDWKPEINQGVIKTWPILLKYADYEEFIQATRVSGLTKEDNQGLLRIAMRYVSPVELARYSLHRWKCCKAGRLGLQAIQSDPILGEIMEKSRYGQR